MGNTLARRTLAANLAALQAATTPQQRIDALRNIGRTVRTRPNVCAAVYTCAATRTLTAAVGVGSTPDEVCALANCVRDLAAAAATGIHSPPDAVLRSHMCLLAKDARTDHEHVALAYALAKAWRFGIHADEVLDCIGALAAFQRACSYHARIAVSVAVAAVCRGSASCTGIGLVAGVACQTLLALYRNGDDGTARFLAASALTDAAQYDLGWAAVAARDLIVRLAQDVRGYSECEATAHALYCVLVNTGHSAHCFATGEVSGALTALIARGGGAFDVHSATNAVHALSRRRECAREMLAQPTLRDAILQRITAAAAHDPCDSAARAIGCIARDWIGGRRCMQTSDVIAALARCARASGYYDRPARRIARAVVRLAGDVAGALPRACACTGLADALTRLLPTLRTEQTRAVVSRALAVLELPEETGDDGAHLEQVLAVADLTAREARHNSDDIPVTARFKCVVCHQTFLRACCDAAAGGRDAPITYCCAGTGRCQAVLCRCCAAQEARAGRNACPLCLRDGAFRVCWRELNACLDMNVRWPPDGETLVSLREAVSPAKRVHVDP